MCMCTTKVRYGVEKGFKGCTYMYGEPGGGVGVGVGDERRREEGRGKGEEPER